MMENFIGPVLTGILSLFLTIFLAKSNSAKIRPKINGVYELRHHELILYISQGLLVTAIIVMAIFWYDDEPDSDLIGGTYATIISIFSLVFYLMYTYQIVTFNKNFIQNSNILGRKKKFKWEDIDKITHNTHAHMFTIVKGKTKMKFNSQMVGIDKLVETIEKKTKFKINN